MNPGSVLEVRSVTVRFGGLTALDAVSLAVPPRHVMGVIGPNGAGKTTLLNVLCGFIRPDDGEVHFGGRRHQVRPHKLASLGVARTLQGVGLYNGLTALENVMVGATSRAKAGFWSALFVAAASRPRRADATRPGPPGARPGRCRRGGGRAAPGTVLRHAQEGRPGPGAGGQARADPARRARERPERGGARRTRRAHPRPGHGGIADGGRAPHGPDDVGLRLDRGARLRQGHRHRVAARGSGQPGGDRGLPRHRRGQRRDRAQ